MTTGTVFIDKFRRWKTYLIWNRLLIKLLLCSDHDVNKTKTKDIPQRLTIKDEVMKSPFLAQIQFNNNHVEMSRITQLLKVTVLLVTN